MATDITPQKPAVGATLHQPEDADTQRKRGRIVVLLYISVGHRSEQRLHALPIDALATTVPHSVSDVMGGTGGGTAIATGGGTAGGVGGGGNGMGGGGRGDRAGGGLGGGGSGGGFIESIVTPEQ